MSADSSRSVEPFRGVDCRPERQGRERANARGAHHQPADWFVPDNVEGPFCQLGELAQHRDENLQQRLDRPREAFFAGDQIAGVSNEVFSARGSELRPASRRTARTTFSIVRISLRTVRRVTRRERQARHDALLT